MVPQWRMATGFPDRERSRQRKLTRVRRERSEHRAARARQGFNLKEPRAASQNESAAHRRAPVGRSPAATSADVDGSSEYLSPLARESLRTSR